MCRFLKDAEFGAVYETLTTAFADYVVPFALTDTQLKNHMILTAVDLNRSVGCFVGERLVGASLNGFGTWRGRPTVYDACTGVLPEFRGQSNSSAMFKFMLPHLKNGGAEQFLLEVISSNIPAVGLYNGLGFRVSRDLTLLQCDSRLAETQIPPDTGNTEIREMESPDWQIFKTFWDIEPSWQNCPEAVDRSLGLKRIIGAFDGGKCVGYILFSARFGRVSQMAVSKDYRRKGVGSALLLAMHSVVDQGYSTQVINADASGVGFLAFFAKYGYYERLRQHEMVLEF